VAETLEFTADAAAFLQAAADYLAANPVLSTVVSTFAHAIAAEQAAGAPVPADRPFWYVLVRDEGGRVVSVAMRTAPFRPYPLFVLPMSEGTAKSLARRLHERGERVVGVNGALPAAAYTADETARLVSGTTRTLMHTRLFELGQLVEPARAPGRLRVATEDELDLVSAWFGAFEADADQQAGRAPGTVNEVIEGDDEIRQRIRSGRVWFWDNDGPVSLTCARPAAFGVSRVGPVYTPTEHRRNGYASRCLAAVSRLLLSQGLRVCLFTDQANPTSNHIYEAIGYRPVADMANLTVDRPSACPE
jgi:predicted GNAT family acetyltransferase